MPNPSATPTPITPPRVALIDQRTGLIDRSWYMFFVSMFNAATAVVDDVVGPDAASLVASYDAALRALADDVGTQPPAIDYSEDITNLRKEKDLNPSSETGELQAQINDVRQELELLPRQELGTFAELQQANLPWTTFNTTPQSVPTDVGTAAWDGGTTLGLQMTTNVLGRVLESQYVYVKASSAITKGQVCMHTGAVGASGTLLAAPATAITTGWDIVGIAAEDIGLNGFGLIQAYGVLRNVNTVGFADGDTLYWNPAVVGGYTKTKPSAPNVKTLVGEVLNGGSAGGGLILVRLFPGSELGGTDSNVQFGVLSTNDLIQYNGTYWTNVTPASVISGAGGPPVTKTANFAVANGETWLINNKAGSSCIVTLPAANTNTGRVLNFQNYQAQTLVSASSNVVPLAGGAAGTAILAAVAGETCTLVSDGSNWIMTQYTPNNVLLLE